VGTLELKNRNILSWSWDNTLRIWSSDGEEIATLKGHTGLVNGALELKDGKILSWSGDKTFRIWSSDGEEVEKWFMANETVKIGNVSKNNILVYDKYPIRYEMIKQ